MSITDRVLRAISIASGVPRRLLDGGDKLKGDLAISHQNFVVLSQNLRAIVKDSKPSGTILLKEIETAAATVDSVIALVIARSNG